jgi:hypothetical protein
VLDRFLPRAALRQHARRRRRNAEDVVSFLLEKAGAVVPDEQRDAG